MNKLLNGMLKIWKGLPDKSKEAFIDNLSIQQQNLIRVGTQLVQNYVAANEQGNGLDQRPSSEQSNVNRTAPSTSDDDDDIIDVEWTEKK